MNVVKALEQFTIPFAGLKQGVHSFDFEVDESFFKCFENSEITTGKLSVQVQLDRKSVLLVFELKATGTVTVPCDRCGDDFEMAVEGQQQLVVKLGNEESNGDDDIIYLSLKENEINIAQAVYEMIALALPYQRIHPDGMCNKEALAKIQLFTAQDLDKPETVDPRWEALKELKFKKKK